MQTRESGEHQGELLKASQEGVFGNETFPANLCNVYCFILSTLRHWKLNYSPLKCPSWKAITWTISYGQEMRLGRLTGHQGTFKERKKHKNQIVSHNFSLSLYLFFFFLRRSSWWRLWNNQTDAFAFPEDHLNYTAAGPGTVGTLCGQGNLGWITYFPTQAGKSLQTSQDLPSHLPTIGETTGPQCPSQAWALRSFQARKTVS